MQSIFQRNIFVRYEIEGDLIVNSFLNLLNDEYSEGVTDRSRELILEWWLTDETPILLEIVSLLAFSLFEASRAEFFS